MHSALSPGLVTSKFPPPHALQANSALCQPLTLGCASADEQRAKAQGKFRLDFSGLNRQHISVRGSKEREALDSDFTSEIEEREKALSRAAPNLKALQQFEAVKVMLMQRAWLRPCSSSGVQCSQLLTVATDDAVELMLMQTAWLWPCLRSGVRLSWLLTVACAEELQDTK